MLDSQTKRRIDDCRDILVGKLPDPKAQIEQITIGLIYKFMDDMDRENIELGGKATFFSGEFEKYNWNNLFNPQNTAIQMFKLYEKAVESMEKNANIPQLFRDIFKNAYLPYKDPETLKLFLKTIAEFEYTHSEKLGDAFEYLLSVMGSQGDAGQFRTPRHIIDFLVEIVSPQKTDKILDPACGTAGFLISAYKYIKEQSNLTTDDKARLAKNLIGYDISPDMVRLSLVNLYLHGFKSPVIHEYDTLTSEERWKENYDVILANPPFMSPKGGIRPHKRFSVNSNRSEVLFVDYIAEHLNPKGRAGIIVPEGVIFQSGNAYKALRKMLVEKYLYAVVSLPAGVFNPYSGVKTSILLFDTELAKKLEEVLFVKIENDGFSLGAQRAATKGSQLNDAVELIKQFREGKFEVSPLAHAVSKEEIAQNGDYNLSGERYKTSQDLSNIKYKIAKIGDIFNTSSGGTPLKNKDEYYRDGTIPWLRSGEVSQGYIHSAELFITKEGLKSSSAKIFPVNTVLVAMYGATAGQVGILKFEASTNQAVCGILPNEEAIPEYLYLILKSQRDYLISLSGGGAQPNISQKIIRELQIPLPPLSVQEEIVEEIEGYQKIIDGAKLVVDNYKPKIDIDPDWETKKLGEIANFKNGLNFSKESTGEKIKILGVSHFKNNLIAPISELDEIQVNETINDSYLLKKGDLVFVRSNGNSDLVGRSIVVPEIHERISFSGFTIRCRLKDDIEPFYIGYLFKSEFHRKLMKSSGRGANISNLSQEILNDITIPLPPIETQKQIVELIDKEQELVNANKQLIQIFEQKIKDRIAKVWGEAPQPPEGGERDNNEI